MIAFLVSAPFRLWRSRGPQAAMKPGSQAAQPLSAEPWRASPGDARRRARLAAQEQTGGRY